MHDLVGAYQRLDRIYQLYIKSAFPLRYTALATERDDILKKPGILSQAPLVEPIPAYPSSGMNLATAAAKLPIGYDDLVSLGQMIFDPGIPLYEHQWKSLEAVILNKKDIVVTTGTGSGKTECFLLPLLAQLAKESALWAPSSPAISQYNWWNGNGNRVSQWTHAPRPKALRALILYPLNALVEDQLRRLRKALDTKQVHQWLDSARGGNRITFGRYTGQTAVSGERKQDSIERLRRELREREQQWTEIQKLQDPELNYYFPRVDGGEMWSRWDMQECPPDILITNYSMLNIMMMRSIENDIFSATHDWLASDPSNEFFLIIDELHSYRGTPGTEIAYILRLLYSRLGLTPNSPQLRILTTTASLEQNSQGMDFLREFFGRNNFTFISGQQISPQHQAQSQIISHQNAFANFAQSVQPDPFKPMVPPDINDSQSAMSNLAQQLVTSITGVSSEEQLGKALVTISAGDALRGACQDVSGSVRATNIQVLDKKLFPSTNNNSSVSDAMRGLLLALGMSKLSNGRSVLPVRGHLFFHNLQSLWVCCNPDCTDSSVNQSVRQNPQNSNRPTVGAIHATHSLTCSCGSRVLDLVVCEVCGEVFLGGYKTTSKIGTKDVEILTPDQPDLEGIPDLVILNQRYGNYRLFWPLPHDVPAWSNKPQDLEWQVHSNKCKWVQAKLNSSTGILLEGAAPPQQSFEIAGWVYKVEGINASEQRALPTKCPRCDSDYSKREQFPTPLRIHRTGFQKACQVLASGLLREMPAPPTPTSRSSRKLVIFSDSRQDAAKLAAGMERDHYRDMVRRLLIESFQRYWGDLVAFLRVSCTGNTIALASLQAENPLLYSAVTAPPEAEDMSKRNQFGIAYPSLVSEAMSWLFGAPAFNPQARDEWLNLIRRYPERIPLLNLRRTVRDALLLYGMCPGGSDFRALNYSTGQNKSQQWEPWYNCYNWTNSSVSSIVNATIQQTNHITRLEDMLTDELMYALFQHIARTLEGIGEGWLSYQPQGNPPQKLVEVCEAIIRQLGIRKLHRYSRYVPVGNNLLQPYLERYIKRTDLKESEVEQHLLLSKVVIPSAKGLALDPDYLYLVLPPNPVNGSRQGYRCPQCNAFFLQPAAGICPECNSDRRFDDQNIPSIKLVTGKTSSDFDYYNYLSSESGSPFRMNAEELTGQTDKSERMRRQRRFQDIFIDNENPRVQGIDLLSVTTTMEAGVDIGSLLAVMMANMPPRRFNYQQRVGRAGRRGVGVSLAVTFCRGRSHDDFYFQRTESITGDPPPPPYVDMASEPIFKRVLIKEVLRQVFSVAKENLKTAGIILDDSGTDNVHGEFGAVVDWVHYKPEINTWLSSTANQRKISSILSSLVPQTKLSSGIQAAMVGYLCNQLILDIQRVVDDSTYTQDKLSERLANAGLLPMFGFPTRVRLLYTRWLSQAKQWPPETGVVDRDLDLAISQFAPSSQTVKDKAVHTAVGVVELRPQGSKGNLVSQSGFTPALPDDNYTLAICGNCQAVTYPYQPNQRITGSKSKKELCLVCGTKELRCIDAREPKGFFTDLRPQDFDGRFEWQPRSTRPSLSVDANIGSPTNLLNASVYAFNENIITVNDNGGKGGFEFQQAKVFGELKGGAYAVSPENSESVTTSGSKYTIALLSRRKTDVLLVNLNQWTKGVFANPTDVIGRAAWYSFAFWLRVAAASLLDVDALELQAGFRSLGQNGMIFGQAFLCDQLENGAGYCKYLAQPHVFQQIMMQADPNTLNSVAAIWLNSQGHSKDCDTSCNLCLRDYQNLVYHGLLDWRLALDMARLVSNSIVKADLSSPWSSCIQNPWLSLVNNAVPATLQRLGYCPPTQFKTLTGYVHRNPKRKIILILRHPLWQNDHPEWIAASTEALAQYPTYTVTDANPFMVLRRPGGYA